MTYRSLKLALKLRSFGSGGYRVLMPVNGEALIPEFAAQPQPQSVDEYGTATFSCSVTGGVAPYSYNWIKNGANVGTNSAPLSFTAAAADNGASVTVVVTDSVGSVITSSAAVLGVTSYKFVYDGLTQYIQLSGIGMYTPASTSLITAEFVGTQSTSLDRIFIESDERNYSIRTSNTTAQQFRVINCRAWLDGVEIFTGATIPTSGRHVLTVTPSSSGYIKTLLSRGTGSVSAIPLLSIAVSVSGVQSNKITLNNKSKGANQLATVGSINATIVNYNVNGWTAI